MKTYKTLIKLQEFEIDRVKKELLNLNHALQEHHQLLKKLDAELARESTCYDTYNQDGFVNSNFDQYYHLNRQQRENIEQKIPLIEEQIELKSHELQACFAELKKIEHILEQKIHEQKALKDKKEQAQLDEFKKKAS